MPIWSQEIKNALLGEECEAVDCQSLAARLESRIRPGRGVSFPRMRVVVTLATFFLVLTTAPAEPPLDCRDIKNGHVCNMTPGCAWPEPYRGAGGPLTTHREHCVPIHKKARRLASRGLWRDF
jgi:hypothetical protein